jgi:hypothetical protein
MRSHTILVLVTTILSSCSESDTKPPTATVEQIEARLARQPCVGSLEKWHREYAFRMANDEAADRNDIRVWFKAAGPHDPAGRFLRETTNEWPHDE